MVVLRACRRWRALTLSHTRSRRSRPSSGRSSGRPTPGHIFVGKNRLSDAFALSAIEHIARDLTSAVTSDEPAARGGMIYASLLAGLAFGTAGTTLAHAIQYPVGAATATPHGLGVGVVLPYVLAYQPQRPRRCACELGAALGAGPGADDAIAAWHGCARRRGDSSLAGGHRCAP